MRRVRILLGVAGILLLSLGTAACVFDSSTCKCSLSSSASKFAYVIGSSDSIAAFTITSGAGTLVPVSGSPFGAGGTPMFGAADPAGKFLYVADPGTQHIFAFNIDQTTGALTAVTGSPFSVDSGELITARMPVVDPTGGFLYVTDFDSCGDGCFGAISAFKIGADGSLTAVAGSPFATKYGALGIAVHPTGGFVYAVDSNSGVISGFKMDSTSGVLTEISGSPFSVGEIRVSFAAVHPSGKFLYATGTLGTGTNGFVFGYSIDPTSGALTEINLGSNRTGMNPQGIDVDGIDNFLFVANEASSSPTGATSGSISVYQIDAIAGTLTQVVGSPFATTGNNPFQLAVDRSCKFLYVTNSDGGRGSAFDYALGFTIDPLSGNLTAVAGSPFSTSSSGPPGGIVLTPHLAAIGTGP